MNVEIDIEIRLMCDTPDGCAVISLGFLPPGRGVRQGVRQCVFHLSFYADMFVDPDITYPMAFHRVWLAKFLEQLNDIEQKREGSARLDDTDGAVVLCISLISRPSGRCVVGGQLGTLGMPDYACEDQFFKPYSGIVRGQFDGLVIDRDQLLNLRDGIKRVLDSMPEEAGS